MHVALLRGINLAARNRVSMTDLAQLFVDAGCRDVRTFIQSGNVLFNAPASKLKSVPDAITGLIAERFGFQIPVVLRSSEQLARTVANNPFLQAGGSEKTLHVMFLAHEPDAVTLAKLDAKRSPPDRFHVAGGDIYLHLPNGLNESKLTNAYFDTKLATKSTARNWATVCKLAELSRSDHDRK